MTEFVSSLGGGSEKLWLLASKTVLAAVVLTCVAGLGVIVAAAVHAHEASQFYKEASDFLAANDLDSFAKSNKLAGEKGQLFLSTESVLLYCHAAVLLLIVAAFLVTGALSVRRMNSMLSGAAASSATSATGRSVRVQILATTTFVFLTFLLRCIDATLYAVASGLNDVGNACPNFESYCDPKCYNTYTHIVQWIAFTPEYSPIIALVSAPITLLVALWGMTSKFAFHQLTKSDQEETTAISRSMTRM
jgi:hypothetical protein